MTIIDCEGYFMGVGLAELLSSEGAVVTVVTPLQTLAPFLDRTFEGLPVRELLAGMGVKWITDAEVLEITSDTLPLPS